MSDKPVIGTCDEMSDIFIDACVVTPETELVLLSVWGRDTAIKEMLARISLPASAENALPSMNIRWSNAHITLFPDKDVLEKRQTRDYTGTLFGKMVNLWLYDKRMDTADYANHSAFVMHTPQIATPLSDRLWSQVMDLTPFPLLSHWQESVMQIIEEAGMISTLHTLFGQVSGYQIHLNTEVLEQHIGHLIRQNALSIHV